MHFYWAVLLVSFIPALSSLQVFAIQVIAPPAPQGGTVVRGNYLGISFELGSLDKYCKSKYVMNASYPFQ